MQCFLSYRAPAHAHAHTHAHTHTHTHTQTNKHTNTYTYTIHMVIYGVYTRFWPTLHTTHIRMLTQMQEHVVSFHVCNCTFI